MKKFLFILSFVLGFISNSVFAMNFIKIAFEQVTNSSSWCNFCCFLVETGRGVAACESYHGYEYWDLFEPSGYQHACLCYAQLLGVPTSKVPGSLRDVLAQYPAHDQCHVDKNNALATLTQNFCFRSSHGVEICCGLKDLQILCCSNAKKECVLIDILSNNDEANNCCKVNELHGLQCSKELCSDSDSVRSPCGANGDFHQKTITETYNEHQNIIVSAIRNLSQKPLKKFKNIYSIIDISSDDEDVKVLSRYIENSAKNLAIRPCNEIREIFFAPVKNTIIHVNDEKITTCSPGLKSNMAIFFGYVYRDGELQPDFIIAHESAHIYQAQELLQRGFLARDKNLIKPGFELSADILGALVSNYSNLAAIGMQWVYDEEQRKPKFVCSMELKGPLYSKNVFKTDHATQVHPSSRTRGRVLIKLSTMIKAAVTYLESGS